MVAWQHHQRHCVSNWSVRLGLILTALSLVSADHYYTNFWVIELHEDLPATEVNQLAEELGFLNYGKVRMKP